MDLSASQNHRLRLNHPAAHLHVQQRFKKGKRRPACIQLTQQTRGALFIGVQIVSLFARLRPQIDNSAPLRVRLFAGRFAPCFFLTSYTWAKSLSGPHDQGGLVGNGSFIGSPQDYYNLENEHSLSGFDLRHRFVQTVLCELPAVGTGAFARHLTGGWKFATIITAQAGFPAGIANGRDTTGTGQGSRADAVAGQTANLSGDQRTWQRWFNTDAFTLAE